LLFFSAFGKTNDLTMKRFAFLLLTWLPLFAGGQPVIDGDCSDAAWRIIGLVNTSGTSNTGFGNDNRLGVLKYHSNSTTLFLAITGNVNDNNNIVLFIDNQSYNGRGPNRLGENMSSVFNTVFKTTSSSCPTGGVNPSEPNGLSGARMDTDFDADFAFAFNKGSTGNTIFLDAVRFSNYNNDFLPTPTPSYLAGPHFVGTCNQSGGTAGYPINITNWNTGTDQFSFAWQNGYDPSTAPNKGMEISIPYAALTGTTIGHQLRFFVLITNADGLASNVCIPGDPGASNLGCSFNLSSIVNSGEDIFYTQPWVVLPLNFLGVSAKKEGAGVRLDWSVVEQGEANYYYIDRSADGAQFERIGFIVARDQGSVAQYNYIDKSPLGGRNIYRLVARKWNGQTVYSRTVSIDNQDFSPIHIFPNPTAEKVFIRMAGFAGSPCRWTLHNALGQPVLAGTLAMAQSVECLSLPPSLPSGSYQLTLVCEGKIASRTLQVRR
jgi:hypothetical protein